jgi:hypothetical protein
MVERLRQSPVCSDALSQIEHERAQCAIHQRRVDEVTSSCQRRCDIRILSVNPLFQVEALLHAAQHGMTALKELARCRCSSCGGDPSKHSFARSDENPCISHRCVLSSPDSKRSEALASQLHAAHARERAIAAELKQMQQSLAELQQKQQDSEFPDENAESRGKRQHVRLRLQRVARDVGDLNLLLKKLSEGKNVPVTLLVQDKRHSSEADVSDADEEVCVTVALSH